MTRTSIALAAALLWASPAAAQEPPIETIAATAMIGGAYCMGAALDLTWTEHDVDALIEKTTGIVEAQGGSMFRLKAEILRAQKRVQVAPPDAEECVGLLALVKELIGKE